MKFQTGILLALAACQASCASASTQWMDWDKLQTCNPLSFSILSSEQEVIDAVKAAVKTKTGLKTVGAGHSFSSITLTDPSRKSNMINLDGLNAVYSVDYRPTPLLRSQVAEFTVGAGIRLRDLNVALSSHGLALVNLGATAAQSVAGAAATGTHGTGSSLGSLSTSLIGFRVVDGSGTVREARWDDVDKTLYDALRLHVGALGIVTEVTLGAVDLFKLKKTTLSMPLGELLERHDELLNKYERIQWSFVPYTGLASVVIREVVPLETPVTGCWAEDQVSPDVNVPYSYQLLPDLTFDATSCVDVSYKALVDSYDAYENRTLYTEMEMFIPSESAVPAMREFIAYQNSIEDQHDPAAGDLYSLMRYVAADDIPLSPCRGRDVAVMSMIVLGNKDHTGSPAEFERYARQMEIIAAKYNGVPHWGKQNWAQRKDIEGFYGKDTLNAFEKLRKEMDPHDIFLNEYLIQKGFGGKKEH